MIIHILYNKHFKNYNRKTYLFKHINYKTINNL